MANNNYKKNGNKQIPERLRTSEQVPGRIRPGSGTAYSENAEGYPGSGANYAENANSIQGTGNGYPSGAGGYAEPGNPGPETGTPGPADENSIPIKGKYDHEALAAARKNYRRRKTLLILLITIIVAGGILTFLLWPKKEKDDNGGESGQQAAASTEVNSEQLSPSKTEIGTELPSQQMSRDEIQAKAKDSYTEYVKGILSGAKETGPFAVKAYDFDHERDMYYCFYSIADFNGDGIDELMLYVEAWSDGFRVGNEEGCEYRFYRFDVDQEKLLQIGSCRVKSSEWSNLRETCPMEFRSNGMFMLKGTEPRFAGVKDGWLYDIGFLPFTSNDGTTYDKEDGFFNGCYVGMNVTSDGKADARIIGRNDGMDYRFTLEKEKADEIVTKVKDGTVIVPVYYTFGKHLDAQLTKDQAYTAVVNYCLKQDEKQLESIKQGTGYYWSVGDLADGEYVVTARLYTGALLRFHVNADYGDVVVYEQAAGSTNEQKKTDISFNAADYLYETELTKQKISSWQMAYAQILRAYEEQLPNRETLGSVKGYLYDFDSDGIPELIANVANGEEGEEFKAYTFINGEPKEIALKPQSFLASEFCGSNTLIALSVLGKDQGSDIRVEFFSMQNGSFTGARSYVVSGNKVEEGTPTPKVTFNDGTERGSSFDELTNDLAQYGLEFIQNPQGKIITYGIENKENRLTTAEWKTFDVLIRSIWGE